MLFFSKDTVNVTIIIGPLSDLCMATQEFSCLIICPGGRLVAELSLPGDKSITHRALILSAIHDQTVIINGWLKSLDCQATLMALEILGVKFKYLAADELLVQGVGLYGLQAPQKIIDAGNSGTTMRLLSGILAAQAFDSIIVGDASLSKRPMQRVIEPLQLMGAKINAVNDNYAPLNIIGKQKLKSINYTLPVASAQVKSAILLADLYAQQTTKITELQSTRNHTELMLAYFKANKYKQLTLQIPGDSSSAAFFIVGASIAHTADLLLENIGINPTRTAFIEILRRMGANIKLDNIKLQHNELSADIRVKASKLRAINIPVELVPNAIDEFPALAIAAACASGTTVIRGARELRYKESDRIQALAAGLSNLGIKTEVFADGLAITGGKILGGVVDSFGDHRIAMAFAMAGLVAQDQIVVQNTCNIATSFPDFVSIARQAGLQIVSEESCYV